MPNRFQNPNLVIKNGAFLLFRMLFVLFLGFFSTRLALQVLGDEKFGIYNIVGGVIAVFAIISLPIRDSLQRFFNVEFAKEQYNQDVVFSTSVRIVGLMIVTITLLYETLGLYLINYVIKYPEEEHLVVNIVFQLCAFANIFGFAELPYVSLLFSRENMSIPAFCEIGRSVLKIIIIYCIPYIPVDALIPYAGIFLLLNVLIYIFYWFYCRTKYPECFVSRNSSKELRQNMLSFSGWSLIEAVAGISLTYISDVFINVFGGVLYNTAYGISKQLQNAVISFTTNVVKASEPQITSGTTIKNFHYRDQLLMTTMKISFLFISFVYVFFCYDGEWLLKLWLGRIPLYVEKFCNLMLLSIVFSSIASPFRTLIMATGKVKGFFSCYGIISLVSMLLMYYLLKMEFPVITVMYLIMASYAVMLINAIFYAKKEASISIRLIVNNLLPSLLSVIISCVVYLFMRIHLGSGIISVFICSGMSFLTLMGVSYLIAFNQIEKNKIKKVLSSVQHFIK